MDKRFHFSRLIERYGTPFTQLTQEGGRYEGGRYIPGATRERPGFGAVVPIGEKKRYESGGTLTEKDRQLITEAPFLGPLSGVQVVLGGASYQVESGMDYGAQGGVSIYTLKWVSAFEGVGG